MKQWKLRYEKSQIIHLFPYILVGFANANCMCMHMPWHTFSSNQRTQMKLWYYPFPPSPFLLLEKRRNSSSYPFCCIIPSSFPWQGEGGVWLSLPTKAVCSWSKSREALNEHELLVICTKSVRNGIISAKCPALVPPYRPAGKEGDLWFRMHKLHTEPSPCLYKQLNHF